MKKILLTIALCAASLGAFAQGQVNFDNINTFGTSKEAVVFDVNGTTKLAGTGFMAQLYWGTATWTTSALGVSTGGTSVTDAPATFFTVADGADGFWNTGAGSARTVGVAGGATVFVQVRAWNAVGGKNTYEAALAAGNAVGNSAVLSLTAGGGTVQPPNLTGLTSFKLNTNIPEPSTIALGILGAGALLLRRRK